MTLEERIARLERQNRWMKRVGGIAVVLVGLFLTVGQSKPLEFIKADMITARGFALVDEKGELRGEWGVRAEGPILALYEKGVLRAFLSLNMLALQDQGRALTLSSDPSILLDGKERGRVQIMVTEEPLSQGVDVSGPSIYLSTESSVASMYVSPTQVARLYLGDSKNAFLLTAHKNGTVLRLDGTAGTVAMGNTPESGPFLAIHDPDKKILFKAP